VAAVELDSAEGSGGTSAMLWSSGAVGLGTKIVLRTSRRPRRVEARFGGAACCCRLKCCYFGTVGCSYCSQSIDHIGHSSIGITILFLNRRVSDVELELRSWIALCLDAVMN
jgi:hypothetical protein